MAIKALCLDDQNTEHLVIGLTRANIESLLAGDIFTLPSGLPVNITAESDIVLLFGETDEDLEARMEPLRARPQ